MKTTKLIASTFIFFALNVNSFATDTSDDRANSSKINQYDIASTLNKYGRNNNLGFDQVVSTNLVGVKSTLTKGRNLEAVESIVAHSNRDDSHTYTKAGSNKTINNEMISMN